MTLDRISPHLIEATIATEDSTFLVNGGIDPRRMVGAAIQNVEAGSVVSGASTITMQLARTIFLLPDGRYDPRVRPTGPAADRVAAAAETFDQLRSATCRERNDGLTKVHNELNGYPSRALRAAYEALNDAVAACYRFEPNSWRDERETLRLLLMLNAQLTPSMV